MNRAASAIKVMPGKSPSGNAPQQFISGKDAKNENVAEKKKIA